MQNKILTEKKKTKCSFCQIDNGSYSQFDACNTFFAPVQFNHETSFYDFKQLQSFLKTALLYST